MMMVMMIHVFIIITIIINYLKRFAQSVVLIACGEAMQEEEEVKCEDEEQEGVDVEEVEEYKDK